VERQAYAIANAAREAEKRSIERKTVRRQMI